MADFNNINFDQYEADYLNGDKEFVLIDVREVDEFAEVRMPGAVNVPLSKLRGDTSDIPQDKDVIIVCARGGRSQQAAEMLAAQGFTNLINMEKGTMDWLEEGKEVERG